MMYMALILMTVLVLVMFTASAVSSLVNAVREHAATRAALARSAAGA